MLTPTLLLLAAFALLGALVEGLSGFGFGLVTMSLLPLVIPVEQAVPMVGAWGLSLNLLNTWNRRRHIQPRRILPMLVAAAMGIPVGLTFLTRAPESLVTGTLGVVILAYVGLALSGRVRPGIGGDDRRWAFLAGLLGGALGGAFNTSGPPVVLYLSSRGWTKEQTIGAMQAFFTFTSSLTFVGFVAYGLITRTLLGWILPILPIVWIGLLVGSAINNRIPQLAFQRLVLGLLAVLGFNFLGRSLLG